VKILVEHDHSVFTSMLQAATPRKPFAIYCGRPSHLSGNEVKSFGAEFINEHAGLRISLST
jgi:hypothetical protein